MRRREFVGALLAASLAPLARAQSLPVSVDWTPFYALPQRVTGDLAGDCVPASMAYAMEMRNILQGGAPLKISELDLNYQARVATGLTGNQTGLDVYTVSDCARNGVCQEPFWPTSVLDPSPAIPDPSQAMISGMNLEPNALARADRINHKLIAGHALPWDRTLFIAEVQASIAAGYPCCVGIPPDHMVCAWGYDAGGLIGFDNRATRPGTFYYDWGHVSSLAGYVVSGVLFTGASAPPGNMQMLTDIIAIAQTGIAAGGAVTQDQKDALAADVSALVVNSGGPSERTLVPPAASFTTTSGDVWTLGAQSQYGYLVMKNGASAMGGQATLITGLGNEVKVYSSLYTPQPWWLWTGETWVPTTPP